MTTFQPVLAPNKLWQMISPLSYFNQGGQLGFINVNLGATSRPDIEQNILDEVGSYGRQLGRIGDVMEVLMKRLDRKGLTEAEIDAIDILQGQLAAIRRIKKRETKPAR